MSVFVEYIDTMLENKFSSNHNFIPHVGDKVWIDDLCYEVTEVIPYFYSKDCKKDKIRVFIDKVED